MTLRTVAALYVDRLGPYMKMSAVECWLLQKQGQLFGGTDALGYEGPHPVVAHPPCGPWGKLRHLDRTDQHGCAVQAIYQVRRYGGVLEHPAASKIWSLHGNDPNPKRRGSQYLARPGEPPDCFGGYAVELAQVEWGHVARKKTWLYLVGVPREAIEQPPFPGRQPTHWASGSRGKSSRSGSPVPKGIKVCSAGQRNRTPPLFAEYLVRLARAARGVS